MNNLTQQIELLMELNKLKNTLRKIKLKEADQRYENSAEHSWHVALAAILFQEHANEEIDLKKVLTMLLIHDVVEIDAGDVFAYDTAQRKIQEEKELACAKRLFGMLPNTQGEVLLDTWIEFETGETAEAKYAKALDRILPILMNYHNKGQSWQEHRITKQQVMEVNGKIEKGSDKLWIHTMEMLEQSVKNGWLIDSKN